MKPKRREKNIAIFELKINFSFIHSRRIELECNFIDFLNNIQIICTCLLVCINIYFYITIYLKIELTNQKIISCLLL